MTELQATILLYIVVVLARIPRINERWIAPLMRGPEWFFDIAIAPDFLAGPGAALLRNYRWRLLLPWAIEGVMLAALWLAGKATIANIAVVVTATMLFTRFNYYAARISTENRARSFELPEASGPVTDVVLSLEPRRLRTYTNWWVEAGIALSFGVAAYLVYFSNTVSDPSLLHQLTCILIVDVYVQTGLLLVKRGLIRSGGAAPAENMEQYLAWRESLRRLSTSLCDVMRLMLALNPLIALSLTRGGSARVVAAIVWGASILIALGYEWRSRREHLAVARQTKPAKFPLLPAARKTRGPVCFWPSLPVLLLRTSNGYALNLASAQVRVAGLYFAGFAALWFWLAR